MWTCDQEREATLCTVFHYPEFRDKTRMDERRDVRNIVSILRVVKPMKNGELTTELPVRKPGRASIFGAGCVS